ncbi:MAG TPA: hypothetical protein VIF43_03705 [Patescibacteria group bacterium]|jgi:hypothetical protein
MAKANVLYAHLADQAFPSEGGKLNLIGMFGGVNAPGRVGLAQFPAIYPRLALAVGLATTEDKLPITVTFRTEDGKDIIQPFNGTFEIQRQAGAPKKEAANLSFNLNFDTIRIEKAGKLYITIESEKDELAEVEIEAVQAQQQPPQESPKKP